MLENYNICNSLNFKTDAINLKQHLSPTYYKILGQAIFLLLEWNILISYVYYISRDMNIQNGLCLQNCGETKK